jgi:hypothetical protein
MIASKIQTNSFCRCIKKVRKTVKLRKGQGKRRTAKEQAAIGICTKSVLQTRGKTLKRFRCGKKPMLQTQRPLPVTV